MRKGALYLYMNGLPAFMYRHGFPDGFIYRMHLLHGGLFILKSDGLKIFGGNRNRFYVFRFFIRGDILHDLSLTFLIIRRNNFFLAKTGKRESKDKKQDR